jgi:hypothetical protein
MSHAIQNSHAVLRFVLINLRDHNAGITDGRNGLSLHGMHMTFHDDWFNQSIEKYISSLGGCNVGTMDKRDLLQTPFRWSQVT